MTLLPSLKRPISHAFHALPYGPSPLDNYCTQGNGRVSKSTSRIEIAAGSTANSKVVRAIPASTR